MFMSRKNALNLTLAHASRQTLDRTRSMGVARFRSLPVRGHASLCSLQWIRGLWEPLQTLTFSCVVSCDGSANLRVFGQTQGLKPLRPVRHANPKQFGATEDFVSTNHVGYHGRATLHPESSLWSTTGTTP